MSMRDILLALLALLCGSAALVLAALVIATTV
jgi:hypothetical protein